MKKKSKKVLLLAGMATATIGITAILHNGYMQQAIPESQNFIQAYKHNPSSILDNLYKKDNMTILPFIFENSDQSITKDEIVSEFANKKLTVTSISTGDKIGTGTQIKVKENAVTYTVVIYGDVNGDGEVNVFDAQECVDNFVNNGENLKGAYKIAANVENTDDEADVFDAQKIVDFFVGIENKLVANEPASTYETDNEAPVISVNGQVVTDTYNMPNIKVGNSYNPPTITAIDNIDGDITASIIESGDTVNTNVAGTYRVNYSVSDAKGNNSQITIIVTVENNNSGGGGTITPPVTPTLSDIKLGVESLILPIDTANNEIKVPIEFYKANERTNLEKNKMELITGSSVESGKLGIKLPSMKILGSNNSTITNNIEVKYYKADGTEAKNSDKVTEIGFTLKNKNIEDIDKINDIEFYIGRKQVKKLQVRISYNDITEITLVDSEKVNNNMETYKYAGKINEVYTVRKDKKFILGALKSKEGERAVTENDLQLPDVTIENNSETQVVADIKADIHYEYNDKGELLLVGTITDENLPVYSVRLSQKENSGIKLDVDTMYIQAVDVPEEFKVELFAVINLNKEEIEETPLNETISLSSENKYKRLLIKTNATNTNITNTNANVLLKKYIDIPESSKIGNLKITPMKTKTQEATLLSDTIKYLHITRQDTTELNKSIEVKVTLFKGCPGLQVVVPFTVINEQ